MKPHTRLDAWKLSFNLVNDLYILTATFSASEKFGIISQIKRAAVSMPTDIAEGAARKSNNEFLYVLRIAYGSLCEYHHFAQLDEISKRISGLISKIITQKNESH